jgi:hypothetical protein
MRIVGRSLALVVLVASCDVLTAGGPYGPPRRVAVDQIPAAARGLGQPDGRYFVRRGAAIELVDSESGRTISSTPVSGAAFGFTYDPERQRFNVLRSDTTTLRIEAADLGGQTHGGMSVPFPAYPARLTVEQGPGGRLLVSVNNRIDLVDTAQWRVAGTWTLNGRHDIHAMRFDPASGHLFVAREGELLMLDGAAGTVLARLGLPVPGEARGTTSRAATQWRRHLEFDASAQRLICAGPDPEGRGDRALATIVAVQSGRLTVVQEIETPGPIGDSPMQVVSTVQSRIWLDPRTHAFYLPIARLGSGNLSVSSQSFVAVDLAR